MIKNLSVAGLLDVYGALLTKRQKQIFEDYYFNDFSLGEIADNLKISRQAVFNCIKTTEKSLLKFEKALNLDQIKQGIAQAISAQESEKNAILNKLLVL